MSKFFGKYRGSVTGNLDPLRMGRLQVSCPFVLGDQTTWAMPCVPFAGSQQGFYMLPGVGANVWVEFEAGEPSGAIWSGCFWSAQQIPTAAMTPDVRTIKTGGLELTLSDVAGGGGVTISAGPPAVSMPCSIKLAAGAIEITIGGAVIKLDGVKVTVNNGALEVM